MGLSFSSDDESEENPSTIDLGTFDADLVFRLQYERAKRGHLPLVEKRGEAEKCFTDYKEIKSKDEFERNAKSALDRQDSNEHFIIRHFTTCVDDRSIPHTGKTEGDLNFVPTLTFGDIILPFKLNKKYDPLNPDSMKRKYILLSESSSGENIWKLLTEKWNIPQPKLVLSFTSGSIEEFEKNKQNFDTFVQNLYRFCKSTGVWIISNGLHCGVSRMLGRIFEFDLEPRDNLDLEGNVTLIGICDWDKLDDKTLLSGISPEEYMSCYFYPKESDLEAFDDQGTLSPFHHVHFLVKERGEDAQIELRRKLLSNFKPEKNTQPKAKTDTDAGQGRDRNAIPVVKFLLGHDETSLDHVKACVEGEIPVVVVDQSGEIPRCLVTIYKKLERLVTCSCNHESRKLTREEKTEIERILHSNEAWFLKQDKTGRTKIQETIQSIMEHRYYLSVLSFNNPGGSDFTNVIRAIYKPYKSMYCMNIALRTNCLEFLETFLIRDIDTTFDSERGFVDADLLMTLHRENLEANAELFNLKPSDLDEAKPEDVYRMIKRTVFQLTRHRCQELFQKDFESLKKKLSKSFNLQFWHLFLYSVLSSRWSFAKCFVSLTAEPIGATLFACKLLQSMQQCAERELETEKASAFEQAASAFGDLAKQILHQMYEKDPKKAYLFLTTETKLDTRAYITPLSLAAESHSMKFMESECCQTYLKKVWTKNMYITPTLKVLLPALILCPFLPVNMISFEEFPIPAVLSEKEEKHRPGKKRHGWWWKVKSFYTAPITKCNFSMISYMTFLGVLSYFFMSELQPVNGASEISATEWLCYFWTIGFATEEMGQLRYIKEKGPKRAAEDGETQAEAKLKEFRLQFFYKLKQYLSSRGNIFDLLMITLFGITTVLRFKLPNENFQLVRIFYSLAIIIFFFRTLRYFYVLKILGPRITAMYMMLMETFFFLLILGIFMIGFGVAFQGLLNPVQPPSWTVLGDVFWRSYWPMFGYLYIDDEEAAGMGRDVGSRSCAKVLQSGEEPNLKCYPFMPSILLAVYLFISNILLLNLLIAIFGNTLNKIESSSNTQWAFRQYAVIYEYYNNPWVPAPLNIPWHFGQILWQIIKWFAKKLRRHIQQDCDDPYQTQEERKGQQNIDGTSKKHSKDQDQGQGLSNDHFWTSRKFSQKHESFQHDAVKKLRQRGIFKQ